MCVCVCVQEWLQDGQCSEECRQQEVCFQRRAAPHLPQIVPTTGGQLQIERDIFYGM